MLKFEVLTACFLCSLQSSPFQPNNRASLARVAATLRRSLPYQRSPTLVSRFYLEWTTYFKIRQWTTTFFREHPDYRAWLRPHIELHLIRIFGWSNQEEWDRWDKWHKWIRTKCLVCLSGKMEKSETKGLLGTPKLTREDRTHWSVTWRRRMWERALV